MTAVSRSGLPTAVLAALLAVLVAGCGVPVDSKPIALDEKRAPFRVFEEAQPPPAGPGRVALYFVRNDRVVLQTRAVERSTSIDELLDLLLAGPTPEQVAEGTRSAIPTTFEVDEVGVGSNGIAVVTLTGSSPELPTSPLGFAQIVATLTAPGRARAVRFRLNDEDLQVPRGDGSLTSDPLDRDDYANLLALPSPRPSPG
jgi:spore germination protein GerM